MTGVGSPREWSVRCTHHRSEWDPVDLVAAKAGRRVAVVIPARDEAATVADVVTRVRDAWVTSLPLVDEVVVIDSDSTDDTAARADAAGARVHRAADVRPDLGRRPGKGEALWKAQLVVDADLVVHVDADLTAWETDLVPGLLGPLLTDPSVLLVKGFYDRPLAGGADGGADGASVGGRVTELVARPLLALHAPELAPVVQPLAGEWAVRRDHLASLPLPTGYGVEVAVLLDTVRAAGLDAVAQVDLGVRAHSHQPLAALGAMATQVAAAIHARCHRGPHGAAGALPAEVALRQFARDGADGDGEVRATDRLVPLDERPPAASVLAEERAS